MKRKQRPEPEPQARVVAVRLANLQRRDREPDKAKRGKQNKPRVRGVKRLEKGNALICIARNRFHNRFHVRSSGFHRERSAEELRTVSGSDRELTAPGTPINPTKITACVEQWGTVRDVEISLEDALKHPDWCPECRAMVESIVMTRKIRSELENAT